MSWKSKSELNNFHTISSVKRSRGG